MLVRPLFQDTGYVSTLSMLSLRLTFRQSTATVLDIVFNIYFHKAYKLLLGILVEIQCVNNEIYQIREGDQKIPCKDIVKIHHIFVDYIFFQHKFIWTSTLAKKAKPKPGYERL